MHTRFLSACRILAVLLPLCPSWLVAAEAAPPETPEPERPRIGLVLGGGGARGAAHIGVLRELERLRVPIDAIAGTSIGAIVGGLYASGMSVEELEALVASLDWQDSFQDAPRRENLRFRRKQDDRNFPIQFTLGLSEGELKLPRGFVHGQKLGLILREKTLGVSGIDDFDDLPIPFRAVASDIASGEAYVIGSGDLALAMRASMSAPGIFAPVEIEGRSLVDGGLIGNVPVDTIRSMGVDVIIAVDVEFPLYEPEQLESALDITAQMLTVLIRKETRRQLDTLGPRDILIRPALGQLGSTEFDAILEAIEPGAEAAAAQAERLRRYALGPVDYEQYVRAHRGATAPPSRANFVRVVDDGVLSPKVLESRLATRGGDPLDPAALARDAQALYGIGTYERVGYRLVTENDRTGVEFYTRAKSWGPNILQFGISFQDNFEGSTEFGVATRLTRMGINPLGAEWRTDLQLGTAPVLRSEFYQPLSFDSRYFVAPRIGVEQRNFFAFEDDFSVARYRVSEGEAGLDAGRELGRWGELRLGVFRGAGRARVKVGDPALPNLDFDTGGLFARLSVDTLDDAQVPLNGTRAEIEWRGGRPVLGDTTNSDSVSLDASLVRSFGQHTWQLGTVYQVSLSDDVQIQNFFELGGFLRLSGLARGEIRGPHAALARLVYYRRIGATGGGLFDMPLYAGASLEAGNVWQRRSDIDFDSLITSGSVFLGLDTYFGPVFVGAGLADGGRSNYYLALGAPPL